MVGSVLAVVGMHRSGTSLVAQWLCRSGLYMGDELLGPGVGNIKGHYEDLDFVSVHSQVMDLWTLDSAGVEPLGESNELSNEQLVILDKLQPKFSRNHDWGWKDPRTCLFLDYYRALDSGVNFLIVFREPEVVVASLLKRNLQLEKNRRMKLGRRRLIDPVNDYLTNIKLYRKYWRAWIDYNEAILSFLQSKHRGSEVFVTSLRNLRRNASSFESWLRLNGFEFKLIEFSEVFDEKLLSSDVTSNYWVSRRERLRAGRVWEGLIAMEEKYCN